MHWSDTCATHLLSEKWFVLLKLSLKHCKNPEKSLLVEALKEALCTTTKNNKMGVLCSFLWCCPTAQLYQMQKVKCHWETPNLPTISQHALWLEQYQSLVWISSWGSIDLIPPVQLCSFQWIHHQEHTGNCPLTLVSANVQLWRATVSQKKIFCLCRMMFMSVFPQTTTITCSSFKTACFIGIKELIKLCKSESSWLLVDLRQWWASINKLEITGSQSQIHSFFY